MKDRVVKHLGKKRGTLLPSDLLPLLHLLLCKTAGDCQSYTPRSWGRREEDEEHYTKMQLDTAAELVQLLWKGNHPTPATGCCYCPSTAPVFT